MKFKNIIFSILFFPIYIIWQMVYKFYLWFIREKWYAVGLLVLVAIGAFLRLWNLGTLGLLNDEIYTGLSIQRIYKYGIPLFENGKIYYSSIVDSYFGFIASLFLGINEVSVRILSAFSGIGTIIVIYFFGRKIHSKGFGLTLSFFLTFFVWNIEFSRWGRHYSFFAFMCLITVFLLYMYLIEGKYKYLFLTFIPIILSLISTFYGVVLFAIVGVTLLFDLNRKKLKTYIFLIFLFISIVVIFDLIISFLTKDFFFIISFLIKYIKKQWFLIGYDNFFLKFIIENFLLLFVFTVILAFFSFLNLKKKKKYLYLSFISLVSIYFIAIVHLHKQPRYLNFLSTFLIISGILFIFDFISTLKNKNILLPILLIITFLYTTDFFYSFRIPFRKYGDELKYPHFGPSLVSPIHIDFKNPFLFLKDKMSETDVFISNVNFYGGYYIKRQLDYWLWLLDESKIGYVEDTKTKTNKGYFVKHYSEYGSYLINDYVTLCNVININKNKGDLYFVIYTMFLPYNIHKYYNPFMESLSEVYNIHVIYKDDKDYVTIYKINRETAK